MPIIRGLLTRDADADDPFLPLLTWWAIESKCRQGPESIIAMFADRQLWQRPLVQQFLLQRIMRRFASTDKRQDLVVCGKLLSLSPSEQSTAQLMRGFEEAYRGRSMVGLPKELNQQLDRIGGGSLVTRLRRGDPQAIAQALVFVVDRDHVAEKRKRLIETLGEVNNDQAVPALISNLDDADASIVHASLVSLQAYPDRRIADAVIRRLPEMPENVQAVACSLLSSRAAWAIRWVEAIQSGGIDGSLVSRDALVDTHRHKNTRLDEVIVKIWGKQTPTSEEAFEAEIRKLTDVIHRESGGNPYTGREIFLKRCANCHTLYNEGGKVGPDLTGYRRQSLDSLLLSVANPSAEIREGFEKHLVITVDGRVISGLVVDQNENIVVIRPASGQDLVIKRQDIEEFIRDRLSLMPSNLVEHMTDQQVRDLFAYLRTGQPLNIRGTPVRNE